MSEICSISLLLLLMTMMMMFLASCVDVEKGILGRLIEAPDTICSLSVCLSSPINHIHRFIQLSCSSAYSDVGSCGSTDYLSIRLNEPRVVE